MTRTALPFLTIALAAAAALSAQAAPASPPPWADITAFFRQQITAAGIVGSSLIVVRDGTIAAEEHVGLRNRATAEPVDADTIYHWASVTKTFTGIAIMQLRDRGLLSLDDPVVRHVPEFRQVHNAFGGPEQVTLRMLMSHTAGLRAPTWPWGGDKPWHPFEPPGWAQLFAMLPYTELQFAPGSRYSYSNPGVLFLGRTIEQLSGEDYEMYVTKNILMPLGMHQTFFDRAPRHLVAQRSHSYLRRGSELREASFDFDTGVTVSNGGLNAPMHDMARYLSFLLGGGPRAGAYDAILQRASLEEMWRPVARAKDGEGGSGAEVQAGLSFFIERHHGVELIGHSGNQNGFLSHIYLHVPSRTAYAIAFNTDTPAEGTRPSTRGVDDAVRDRLVRNLAEER